MRGSTITLEDYPVEDALRMFRGAGFNSLEMWKHHLKKARTVELRSAFAASARSSSISMGGFNAVGEDYFQPFGTAADFERTIEGVKSETDFALALGTKDVLLYEGRAPAGTSEGHWLEKLLPRLVDLFRGIISYGKPLGVRYLIEPHPFTVGMSDTLLTRLCDSFDPSDFGVTYDFCHYGVGRPADYIPAIRKLGHRIKHLHFSDSDQKSSELHFPPGKGKMNIPGMLQALKEIHYKGTATLDLYAYPLPVQALAPGAASLREACDFLEIEESTGAAFG
jgi:sugar phosphate isomerase/epimerase